mmetsp:Transcript_47097/g.131388  ORF Transcript_47097/g.131388 Transcript_47097/m.131388 type:complete len:226 (-) Transcript_47097:103-780(-)|eukprot:CAMPEP_0117533138 /NCGR_PEP_ID=MMETSP0784-20121206/39732_1 /TAXON_ID=39447 /ORGANISM="" /LENGTH=225 /DNA_ID=CAMNT_0005329559 /DNA_START=59 /DNA_END=736 /DNA_ORIENTATION=+
MSENSEEKESGSGLSDCDSISESSSGERFIHDRVLGVASSHSAFNSRDATPVIEPTGSSHLLFDTSESSNAISRSERPDELKQCDDDDTPKDAATLHFNKMCTPCRYVWSSRGCRFGAMCKLCHLPHDTPDVRARRQRPGKNLRVSFNKYCAKLKDEQARDPENFDVSKVQHPKYIQDKPSLQRALMKRLASIADELKRLRTSEAVGREPSTSAARGSGVTLVEL